MSVGARGVSVGGWVVKIGEGDGDAVAVGREVGNTNAGAGVVITG